MSEKKQRLTRDELPEVIEPIHVQQFLDISRSNSYKLMGSGQFHVVRIGQLYKAPKEAFLKWWMGESS